ncbi:MAG: CDGSH iron-sulfur domain-containing protein [Planctomycetota bacterium]
MSNGPSIQCAKNGPLLVKGLETLTSLPGGEALETKEVTALCRCGYSQNKPYCDGAHKVHGFTDERDPERTPDARMDYVGKKITIHDNRGVCAHAGFCTDRLSSVFRMGTEPWIDPDGAAVDEIKALVKACPSGALSYSIDGVEHRDLDSDPQILVAPKGPYVVKGAVEIADVEWGTEASREHYDLCRCGESKNKPFCDGSHWNSTFDG